MTYSTNAQKTFILYSCHSPPISTNITRKTLYTQKTTHLTFTVYPLIFTFGCKSLTTLHYTEGEVIYEGHRCSTSVFNFKLSFECFPSRPPGCVTFLLFLLMTFESSVFPFVIFYSLLFSFLFLTLYI